MSKKVLIDKQALIDKLMKIPGIGSNSDALKTIKRFPSYEPQKIKVPEFVAKWFETNKYVLDRAILDYMFEDYASDDSEFGKWFDNKNGKPIETLVRMLDGYEVEEEPKWKIINDQKYCLTSIEAGYDNSLHWAFDSTKKKPILFDNEETAMYTAYITGGTVEKV
ncbi:DUF1642 domain-containing protein [Enterococcus devriesei]|uniref:DUF1642 domain-containing protein n=1 Tax=Enterococcus devriesei TaxID=319970 RepID=UPI0028E89C60|nr:DUF1642 domain-containing protein [Enterococcus devriesei]